MSMPKPFDILFILRFRPTFEIAYIQFVRNGEINVLELSDKSGYSRFAYTQNPVHLFDPYHDSFIREYFSYNDNWLK